MIVRGAAPLVGVAILVLVVNVAFSYPYTVLNDYLFPAIHDEQFSRDHLKVAAPYCSIVEVTALVAARATPRGAVPSVISLLTKLAEASTGASVRDQRARLSGAA